MFPLVSVLLWASGEAQPAVRRRDRTRLQGLGKVERAVTWRDGRSGWRELPGLAAAAYCLHNIYNAIENSCEQISRTFENHIVDPAQWHRELLEKMFLELPGWRPRLFPEELRSVLNDLSGFRHLFRHTYDFQLDAV